MNFEEYKAKVFAAHPDAKKEYDALAPQYALIQNEIMSRKEAGITQKELAERMGTAQSNISRFEKGSYNPSLSFLNKMAKCLGKDLQISFE